MDRLSKAPKTCALDKRQQNIERYVYRKNGEYMKVQFQGPIDVIQEDEDGENEELIVSPDILKKLDGRVHDSEVADYLFDGPENENLKSLNISGGIISLCYKDGRIFMYVDYFFEKTPDDSQIKTLWRYTEGQLSDGAGPIFSGNCQDKTGLYPLLESEKIETIIDENT